MIFFALIPLLLIAILLETVGQRLLDWFSDITHDDPNILALTACLFASSILILVWRWMERRQAPV